MAACHSPSLGHDSGNSMLGFWILFPYVPFGGPVTSQLEAATLPVEQS